VIAGMSGSLLSHDAVERLIATRQEPALWPEKWTSRQRRLRAWHADLRTRLGPSAGPRVVFDLVAAPLASELGFLALPVPGGRAPRGHETLDAELRCGGTTVAVMVAAPWGHPARSVWRHSVHRGLAHGARWALCVNGPALCVFDVERAYARRFVEFDLAAAFDSERTLAVLCGLIGAGGLTAAENGTLLERVMLHSERHRSMVRLSLRNGVYQALLQLISAFRLVSASRRIETGQLLDESLVVIYRLLFLLFAEARGLVPQWHPIYRDSYSIGGLRREIADGIPRGLWATLQAVARLAHRGCTAGTLKVPPFNGRLFSPSQAPLAANAHLNDHIVSEAVRALTTRVVENGRREEIAYEDLGVEQLGGVYEHLLDFDLATAADGGTAMVATGRRKSTGSFYTPRSLTEFIVRRALGPVVERKSPEQILALRVLDPAMGSGAFLVAACRYLASSYEAALVREGGLTAADISESERADFRRVVAQRCLYGVDVNPMAVQLARLSLWLATLAADKPLTFLDHRLRVGNSLIGASLDDLRRAPRLRPGRAPEPRQPSGARASELPLFPEGDLQLTLRSAVGVRATVATVPDDSLQQVRAKERDLAALERPGGALERWRAAADLWCATYLDPQLAEKGLFTTLRDHVVAGAGALPPHTASPLMARGREAAARERVFHWTMEFPEVFHDDRGAPLPEGGFDAILGNPPWEMLRGEGTARAGLIAFVKRSGQYRLQGDGHANLYQLFFERGLGLLGPNGRCGVILPAGFASDQGNAILRRHLFDHAEIETFTIIDNGEAIFPIHRALKFLLLTFRSHPASQPASVPLRSGVRAVDRLDRVADAGPDPDALQVPRALLERVSGESLAVPDIRTPTDLLIVSLLALTVPASSDPAGWGVHFGRELNATEDRPHFNESGSGMPVIEGKQLRAFRVGVREARYWIATRIAAGLVAAERTFGRARLAYRDVASAGNRMTLIAAIVPPQTLTTHTLFCLKETLDEEAQQFLCGVMNSYVANYLIRMRVSTHVTTAIVSRLPLPRPSRQDVRFGRVVRCARVLAGMEPVDHFEHAERLAELNAAVASLYGLGPADLEHILGTFPLVPEAERRAALRWYHSDFFDPCAR
jgi:hypothetical protein